MFFLLNKSKTRKMKKEVKIIGLSVNKDFGALKATELKFNENNKLTVVKGEVGSGKTTLNKALSLTTKGSKTLEDNRLYGDVDLTAQLLDGEYKVFVNCKSNADGKLVHKIYTIDESGNRLKDVVIDGQKLTPANYLKSLQTSLTWRLDELTSENPVTQRNILLELYQNKLEDKGVIFNKDHPKYTQSIIHDIEVAKNNRSYADMKRKEVGGIGEDLSQKGIDVENRRELKPIKPLEAEIQGLEAEKAYQGKNSRQAHENALNELKTRGIELNSKLKDFRDSIKEHNEIEKKKLKDWSELSNLRSHKLEQIYGNLNTLDDILPNNTAQIDKIMEEISDKFSMQDEPKVELLNQLEFNEKSQCTSKPENFKDNKEIFDLLNEVQKVRELYYDKYQQGQNSTLDTSKIDNEIEKIKNDLESNLQWNKEAKAVNAFHDWKDANDKVKELQNDYYKKLTEIDTGVDGLHIALESKESENIFLMYNGAYDVEYFHNPNKELRKLSSYSDTQKPLICLLIQNYLLKNKGKAMPYLWIDKVPIDNKTKDLLEKMSQDLGLWLFVSWTGDFNAKTLSDGELLIENGEVFFKDKI